MGATTLGHCGPEVVKRGSSCGDSCTFQLGMALAGFAPRCGRSPSPRTVCFVTTYGVLPLYPRSSLLVHPELTKLAVTGLAGS